MPKEDKNIVRLTDEQQQIVLDNIPLVYYVTQKYRHIPEDAYKDLISRLYLRLCKSVIKFDVNRGFKISSFLVKSLEGEIKNYFRDDVWPIKPPRPIREKAFIEIVKGSQEGEESSENMDTVRSCTMPVSIDSMTEDGEGGMDIPDHSYHIENRVVDALGGPQIVREVFQALRPEERTILCLRMKGRPFSEIQSRFRVSRITAIEVWEELQRKVRHIHHCVMEGLPVSQSEGSTVLNRELILRFTPPKSTSIAVRRDSEGIKV